jgi:hypothetical protein
MANNTSNCICDGGSLTSSNTNSDFVSIDCPNQYTVALCTSACTQAFPNVETLYITHAVPYNVEPDQGSYNEIKMRLHW